MSVDYNYCESCGTRYFDDKNYKKIEFTCGSTIKDAVEKLLEYNKKGKLVYGDFNGHILYSDIVTLDSAHIEILGKTYAQAKQDKKEWHENYKKEQEEHKKRIPILTLEWKKRGREILDKKYLKLWDKIVPIRLGDLYKGMELKACLDIIEVLNSNCSMEEAKNILYNQGHSAMSAGLTRNMIAQLCERGEDFFNYTK